MNIALDPEATNGRSPVGVGSMLGKILLVDDDTALLGLVAQELIQAGCDVATATDGIDALSSMYARRPDAIVVDMMMPRMSGEELIAQVCADDRFREVLVVAMSGREPLLRRAADAGASTVLIKPLNVRSIMTAVTEHLRRRGSGDVALLER